MLRGIRGSRRLAQLALLVAAARPADHARGAWRAVYRFFDDPWEDAAVVALIVLGYVGLAAYIIGFDWLRAHLYY